MININIRTGPVAQLSIDELVIAVGFMGMLHDRIHENGHDVPESIKSEFRACERELTERLRADKERQLKVLESRHESLLTVPEKRKRVEAEIDSLRKELGVGPSKKVAKTA